MSPHEPLNPHLPDYYNRRRAAERDIGVVVASLVAQGAGGATSAVKELANQGFCQETVGGAVYWSFRTRAQFIDSRILARYRQLGGDVSVLGYPVSHNAFAADGVGMFSLFQQGVIYWHPQVGAFEVRDGILEGWRRLGSEAFGYPTSGVLPTREDIAPIRTRGYFSHFRSFHADGTALDKSIYSSSATGANAVWGAIRGRWWDLGAEASYLGFPVSDEEDWADPDTQEPGRVTHFERGAIAWRASDGKIVEFPERKVFRANHIGVSSVGGWAQLIITSSGSFHFSGHLHNSGFVGLACTVGCAIKVPGTDEAVVRTFSANVGGTTSLDSRDEDWSEEGYEVKVRAYWDKLRGDTSMAVTTDATLGGWELVTLILLPLVGAAVAISLISGTSPPDTGCRTSNWHTVRDGNHRTVREPQGVRCGPGMHDP